MLPILAILDASIIQPSSTVLLLGLLIIIGIYKLLYLAQQADNALFRVHPGSPSQGFNILENEFSLFSHWTAHDTIPVTCYSHNAHGRRISLQSAISSGCMSIEMTLFPAGNDVLVAPNPDMLSQAINLRGVYIGPLLEIIREHNTKLEGLHSGANKNEDDLLSVEIDPTQTLVLLMDFDADPERIWSQLLSHLKPLREAGYLTYFNGSEVVQGPIKIVATGNVPFYRVLERSPFRGIFYDAPLLELSPQSSHTPPRNSDYSKQNSYYASADFHRAIGDIDFNGFSESSESQLFNLRQQVQIVHELGLKIRYWGTPNWSRELRNYVAYTRS
ncbi:hypothetical protein N7474_005033 [Penicillium riverlandense]|uniref:uncharacterized protein n=1 Tax=Penicillium riverlandense TaxID=1903569 RepID=UPI0025474C22|nr:uncharacterized protein N7474_005033 [Penicillium riverlandense]KAJ5819442.1 hypothetical protein N7474_005033 [Penicillium riverlandense]